MKNEMLIEEMQATAKAYEAEAKAARRAIQKFYEQADKNQEHLLKRWNTQLNYEAQEASDNAQEAANKYGCTVEDLWAWVLSDGQAWYYRREHPKAGGTHGEEKTC